MGDLIVTSGGRNLRALSPANGIVMNPSFLSGYYDDYVKQVWAKYSSATLTVDTQASYGTVTGQVSGGYAFPYDDVAPTGGADQSGSVSSASPAQLSVTLGSVH